MMLEGHIYLYIDLLDVAGSYIFLILYASKDYRVKCL